MKGRCAFWLRQKRRRQLCRQAGRQALRRAHRNSVLAPCTFHQRLRVRKEQKRSTTSFSSTRVIIMHVDFESPAHTRTARARTRCAVMSAPAVRLVSGCCLTAKLLPSSLCAILSLRLFLSVSFPPASLSLTLCVSQSRLWQPNAPPDSRLKLRKHKAAPTGATG